MMEGKDSSGVSGVSGVDPSEGDTKMDTNTVSVRIFVPELNVQKVLHFHREELVWNVKQQCLATLPKELKESFNYGLFYPPCNGRAGKFLDEERPLSDYPFNGPGGYLELKYKRRVYKMLNLDEKQLRSLQSRVNIRRFFDYVSTGQTEKITKLCSKGLDPNTHLESGETPLTVAAVSSRPSPLLLALVGGGALIDYRTRCGSTALHRAAEKNNIEAVRTLLDLGASPNVRDAKGLTPLYNAILNRASPMLCLALLHDYSIHGVQDAQGWQEVHQACRNGLVPHLENLLFYGCEMNAKNASGNTPLHVCAVDNGDACARLLLFRGADKEALNFANQTPYQVAVIAGNLELAALIHRFRSEDVVPFKETPTYNPRRRKSGLSMRHSVSSNLLEATLLHSISSSTGSSGTPSPTLVYSSLSNRSSNSLQPSPSISSSDRWLELNPLCMSTVSVRSDTGSSSSCTAESEDNASANGSSLTDKISVDQCDIVSDSSGVGTSNSGSGGSYDATPSDHSLLLPGMTVVCTEPYSSKEPNHLQLMPGDIIEVSGSTDCGLLEGWLRGDNGYFLPSCVQEVRLRHPAAIAAARSHLSPSVMNVGGVGGVPGIMKTSSTVPALNVSMPVGSIQIPIAKIDSRTLGRRELSAQNYGTAPRIKALYGEPRTVILHKGQRGFGFVLRGAKMTNGNADLHTLQHRVPALQYLDSVEAGSVADRAGLQPGDFILAINGEDLAQASHEKVVDYIRRSGNLVTLTVCSSVKAVNEYAHTGPTSRQYSTLPRKLPGRPPQPPKRDPKTTLSVGRARARSMVIGLTEMEMSLGANETEEEIYSNSRTASIRSRSGSGRISTTDLERLSTPTAVSPPAPPSQPGILRTPRVYASVAEMKRVKKQKTSSDTSKIHKEFHSTPELCWDQVDNQTTTNSAWTGAEAEPSTGIGSSASDWRKSQSQEDVFGLLQTQVLNRRNSRRSWAHPFKSVNASGNGTGTINPLYHGSWQNVQQQHKSEEELDDEDDDTEEEGQFDEDDAEDATTPIADQQLTLLGNGDYRAVKQCRPVYSSSTNVRQRANSPHAPPPDHPPPPPPPPSTLVRVDVTAKPHSEYATGYAVVPAAERPVTPVMSSFRPSDNAKLYATPEDSQNIGYMTLRSAKKVVTSPTSSASSGSSGSSAARSKSLPPRSVRPGLLTKAAGVDPQTQGRVTVTVNSAPLIPDPDYDVDEDFRESCNGILKKKDSSGCMNHGQVKIEIKDTGSGVGLPKSQSFCSDILKAKSQLKTSQSYPEELNEQTHPHDTDDAYVTFLAVNKDASDTIKRRPNSSHAVSLIQLPPPDENGDTNDVDDAQQDSVSTISTLSSLSSGSGNSSDRDTTILENRFQLNGSIRWKDPSASVPADESTEAERTIEQSLQLIRKHVSELSGSIQRPTGSKTLPDVPPPPEFEPETDSFECSSYLPPPPPEFSDPQLNPHSYSRTLPKSLSSSQFDHVIDVMDHRRPMERRFSDDAMTRSAVRVVGAVPKKVSFSPDVMDSETSKHQQLQQLRGFGAKHVGEWTVDDVADWLDSLFLGEYKATFIKKDVDGRCLLRLNNDMLLTLGVKRVGHRLNIEKSLKHHLQPRS